MSGTVCEDRIHTALVLCLQNRVRADRRKQKRLSAMTGVDPLNLHSDRIAISSDTSESIDDDDETRRKKIIIIKKKKKKKDIYIYIYACADGDHA